MCSQGRTIKSKYRLKLCPFCGAEAELIERLLNILYEGEKDYVVICSNEECHGCRPCTCGSTEEEAVANWNKRFDPTIDNLREITEHVKDEKDKRELEETLRQFEHSWRQEIAD